MWLIVSYALKILQVGLHYNTTWNSISSLILSYFDLYIVKNASVLFLRLERKRDREQKHSWK